MAEEDELAYRQDGARIWKETNTDPAQTHGSVHGARTVHTTVGGDSAGGCGNPGSCHRRTPDVDWTGWRSRTASTWMKAAAGRRCPLIARSIRASAPWVWRPD